jgi:hypothetical protein
MSERNGSRVERFVCRLSVGTKLYFRTPIGLVGAHKLPSFREARSYGRERERLVLHIIHTVLPVVEELKWYRMHPSQ